MSEVNFPLISPQSTVQQQKQQQHPSYSTIPQQNQHTSKDDEERQQPNPTSSTFTFWKSKSYAWSLAGLILLLVVFTALEFALLKLNLPSVDPDALKFPRNLEDLRQLNRILSGYIDKHFINVYITFVATYIYLQSFSIPGSMWLSVLGGTLFNFWLTLFTVSMCSAVGATLSFIISGSLGSKAVMHLIGDRIAKWNEQLVRHKQNMLNYMIVLRIAPFPPNWTVNLGAPHLGVPLSTFFWGTLIGVTPPSFLHVQAGAAFDRLSSSDKLVILTPLNVACLVGFAIAALIPVFIRRYYPL
ncbi:snare associated Golgi protein-domain-containing protein [Chlamydoabsidia padenii]|nr:snare associated Golgi protein-domain-containing protein [Chlamydoabsidia padenii]